MLWLFFGGLAAWLFATGIMFILAAKSLRNNSPMGALTFLGIGLFSIATLALMAGKW